MSKSDDSAREEKGGGEIGNYVQIFVYRVPKEKHDAMASIQNKLAAIFKKYGVLRSEFFQLSSSAKTFKGFTSIRETVSSNPDEEEIWLELEYYKDQKESEDVIKRIGQDPSVGPLFGQVLGLVTQGSSSLQGDFNRLHI